MLKSSVMRGHTFVGWALGYIPRSHGGIAYPPNPRRSFGRNIQREMPDFPYIREKSIWQLGKRIL